MWVDLYGGLSLTAWANSAPIWFVGGILARLGVSFPVNERILWLWPFEFGAPLAGYYLCYRFSRNVYGSALGSMLFTINTWSIGLIERGHIPALDSYMLSGFVLPAMLKFSSRPSVRSGIALAALVSLQCLYEIRYGYISVVSMVLVVLFSLPRLAATRTLLKLPAGLIAFGTAMVALNLTWLLPFVLCPPSTFASYTGATAFADASHFGSLIASFGLYFPFYRHVLGTDAFKETGITLPFLAVAFAAWTGLVVTRNRRTSRVLLLLAAIGIALSTGARGPFASVNAWLFLHAPGFGLFRDFSKFTSVIAQAYAVGVCLVFCRLMAIIRSTNWRAPAWATCLIGVVAAVAYAVVLKDALNPLRLSNFAQARGISASTTAYEAFLDRNLDHDRVMMFPSDPNWQVREPFIPSVDAGYFALDVPPKGFAFFNSSLDGEDSPLGMMSSPLCPAMLSQLQVKYIVVPGDHALYYDFDGRVPYWESLDFLRRQPWVREIGSFGNSVIFQLNLPPVQTAFFAPYPTLIIGSPPGIEGLVGSYWGDKTAALVLDQMPPDAGWLSTVPNVVQAPELIDPSMPVAWRGNGGVAERLALVGAAERYRRHDLSVQEFSSSMLTTTFGHWTLDQPFTFRFQTAYTAPAKATFLLQTRRKFPSVLFRNSGVVAGTSTVPGAIDGTLVDCFRAASWGGDFAKGAGTIEASPASYGQQLYLNNACPVAYQATVHFKVTSGDGLPLPYSITYGTLTRSFVAPPTWGGFFAGSASISDVVLRPGLNLFQFNKTAARAMSIRSAYEVTDYHQMPGRFKPDPLELTLKRSPSGTLVYASMKAPRAGMYIGYVDLFGATNVPLDEHPVCTIRSALGNVSGEFDIVLDLRNRNDGTVRSLWIPVDQNSPRDYDLYDIVRKGLLQRFDAEAAYRSADPVWMLAHVQDGPPVTDDYILTRTQLAVTWSVAQEADVPHGEFVMLVNGLRLAHQNHFIGTKWSVVQSAKIATSHVSDSNVALRAAKLLRISSGDGYRIDAQVSRSSAITNRIATTLKSGDYVELLLQTGQRAKGTIIGESSDYVLLQDGDGPVQRIGRNSISTIARQEITPSAKLYVPINSPFKPSELSFEVKQDSTLLVRIGLDYESAGGAHETIPAVDSEESDARGSDVEPDFVQNSHSASDAIFDLSVPIDVGLAQGLSMQDRLFDIDLWNVEHYRFGGQQRRLVGLSLEFTQPPTNAMLPREFSLTVFNLLLARDRPFVSNEVPSAAGQPLATLDGRPLKAARTTALRGTEQYYVASTDLGELPAGSHVIASKTLDQVSIRAVAIARGTRGTMGHGRVTEFQDITPSESAGTIAGGGLLVIPRSYDSGWRLAIWPTGAVPPALTGLGFWDWLRTLPQQISPANLVPINSGVEGWHIAGAGDGERRFVIVYFPEALGELGFAATLLAALAFAIVILRRRRRGWGTG